MRSTDTVSPVQVIERPTAGEPPQWSSGNTDVRINQPLPPPISVADRVKAAGLIALTGGLGVAVLLAGMRLLSSEREEALLPIPGSTDDSLVRQKPLRDRVQVITPATPSGRGARISLQPQATQPGRPLAQTSRQSAQAPTPTTSYGFGKPGRPSTVATNAAVAAADQPNAATPAQSAAPVAKVTAPKATPPNPLVVIAALLQAPQPQPSGAIATIPSPVKIPPVADHPPTQQPPPDQTPVAPSTTPATPVTVPPPERPVASPPLAPEPATATTSTAPTPVAPVTSPPPAVSPPETTPTAPAPVASQPPATTQAVVVPPPPPLQDGVYVERLQITGNTRFSQSELGAVVQAVLFPPGNPANGEKPTPPGDPTLLNRQLSPAELVRASEAITKFYVDKGYINSGAYVPAEVLNGAAPEIRVVEGKLEAINVQVQPPGFLWFARRLSPKYVQGRLARAVGTPLQIDQLVEAVKLLEQDPLIDSISTELAPGTTTGTSVLNVKVRQANPLQAFFSIDNGRSPSVGQLRQTVGLTHANLLGLGDSLQLGFNRSEGSREWNVGYTVPINSRNGTIFFRYNNSQGEVIEEPFRELDIKGRSQNYEIGIRQPLKQTASEVIALTLRGTHYRNEGVFLESFNNGEPLPLPGRGADDEGKTRVTAIRFGQEWTKRSEKDVISLQSDFNVGINALGATQLELPPDSRFFMWQGRGFWVHAFAPDTLFALKAQLQLANRPLVPVEQISMGGIDTVRGYRASTLLTDNGFFASAEAYLPILRIPKWQSVVQIVPFFDVGRGWNRGDAQPDPGLLMSTGLGLQWKIGEKFRARLDWGIPLVNATTDNGQSLKESLFFSIVITP